MEDYNKEDMAYTMGENTLQKAANSPLTSALQVHEKNHSDLADALSQLEHRLGSLLRPQEQTSATSPDTDKGETPIRSDLVAGIENSSQRLRHYTDRLRVLLERLEV